MNAPRSRRPYRRRCGDEHKPIRVMTPNRVAEKLGMPAAPLLITKRHRSPQLEAAANRQAGVGAGKAVNIGRAKRLFEPRQRHRIIQAVVRKAPAGERFGVAVNDADGYSRRPGICAIAAVAAVLLRSPETRPPSGSGAHEFRWSAQRSRHPPIPGRRSRSLPGRRPEPTRTRHCRVRRHVPARAG